MYTGVKRIPVSMDLNLVPSPQLCFKTFVLFLSSPESYRVIPRGWSYIYHVLTPVSTSALPSVYLCFLRNFNQLLFCQPRPVLSPEVSQWMTPKSICVCKCLSLKRKYLELYPGVAQPVPQCLPQGILLTYPGNGLEICQGLYY